MDGFAVVIKAQMELMAEVYLSGSQCYLVLNMRTVCLWPD